MVDNAISRVARAMDVIPYVLENPGIKIETLATKFGVDQKQIIKELELIFLCGLPGYTPYELIDLTFEDGFVTIIDPQLFDKPRKFTETEGVIINLGLVLLKNSISDTNQIQVIDHLIQKLTAKFKVTSSAVIEKLSKPDFYDEITKSINQNDSICIDYASISEDSLYQRLIKPLRISIRNGFYYLYATDLEKDVDRVYRMDQIRSISSIQSNSQSRVNEVSENDEIDFELMVVDQLITEKFQDIFTEVIQSEKHFRVKGKSSNRQWLYRWILSHGSAIQILGPEKLKESVRARAQSALDHYQI
jgi:predicted DNA-binding transcriptional regulator YafY